MSVSYSNSTPVVAHMHFLRDESAQFERLVMEEKLKEFDEEVRLTVWRVEGHHDRFVQYVDEHPDELLSYRTDTIQDLARRADAE
jgi:aromatic ring-opening dioxygenase catalytic subunit (LigB family)